jgi:hypothetical protein
MTLLRLLQRSLMRLGQSVPLHSLTVISAVLVSFRMPLPLMLPLSKKNTKPANELTTPVSLASFLSTSPPSRDPKLVLYDAASNCSLGDARWMLSLLPAFGEVCVDPGFTDSLVNYPSMSQTASQSGSWGPETMPSSMSVHGSPAGDMSA